MKVHNDLLASTFVSACNVAVDGGLLCEARCILYRSSTQKRKVERARKPYSSAAALESY